VKKGEDEGKMLSGVVKTSTGANWTMLNLDLLDEMEKRCIFINLIDDENNN